MTETERSRREEEGEHPEVDRAYDHERGGRIPDEQADGEDYEGPDPEDEPSGLGDDEDQGI